MHATRELMRRVSLVAVAVLCSTPASGRAQAQQGAASAAAGALTLTTKNATAAEELRAAIDDYFQWNWKSGATHAARALELDPGFALARIWLATYKGGPTVTDEMQRAVVDAANATAAEATLALASRESAAGRAANARRLLATAADLAPNDRQIQLWRAASLAGADRVNALRDVAKKYPDDAGSHVFLALYLTTVSFSIDSATRANGDEALRAAADAVRLAPKSAGSHTIMGYVLHALGRDAEAMPHLVAAAGMTPKMWYTFDLMADINARDGKFSEVRPEMDSVIAWAPALADVSVARRVRAATFLSEGDAARCMAELTQQLSELEAIHATGQIAATHGWMAIMAGGAHDSAGAMQHLAAQKAAGAAPGTIADNEVVVYSLIGNGTEARRALGDYIRINSAATLTGAAAVARDQNFHRMTGLTLLAEKKPQEALPELRQGGANPYASLGIIEAYRAMKDTKNADAERAAFFARREFTYGSSAMPVIRYRAKH